MKRGRGGSVFLGFRWMNGWGWLAGIRVEGGESVGTGSNDDGGGLNRDDRGAGRLKGELIVDRGWFEIDQHGDFKAWEILQGFADSVFVKQSLFNGDLLKREQLIHEGIEAALAGGAGCQIDHFYVIQFEPGDGPVDHSFNRFGLWDRHRDIIVGLNGDHGGLFGLVKHRMGIRLVHFKPGLIDEWESDHHFTDGVFFPCSFDRLLLRAREKRVQGGVGCVVLAKFKRNGVVI